MPAIGFLAKLSLDDGAGTFTEISECTLIQLPTVETAVVEVTYLNQTDAFRKFQPGLSDSGTMLFECHYTPTAYNVLQGVNGFLKDGADQTLPTGNDIRWKVESPTIGTSQVFTMKGILNKLEVTGFDTESVIKIKGEVKVTGEITIA